MISSLDALLATLFHNIGSPQGPQPTLAQPEPTQLPVDFEQAAPTDPAS